MTASLGQSSCFCLSVLCPLELSCQFQSTFKGAGRLFHVMDRVNLRVLLGILLRRSFCSFPGVYFSVLYIDIHANSPQFMMAQLRVLLTL
jgi:hypothetical protein